jgi:uncharacterized protein (DUF433 family)
MPHMLEADKATLLGEGIYTLPQAARLAKVPAPSVRRWLFGYRREYRGESVEQPAILQVTNGLRDLRVVTFRDLIEIHFVHAFREAGVSWATIRRAAEAARTLTGSKSPFASEQFVTDGEAIFAEVIQATGSRELLNLSNNQMAFRRVLMPSLKAKLDFSFDGASRLWPLGKTGRIVLDRNRQFGQPIVRDEGVPTEVLNAAYKATNSVAAAARWYNVNTSSVRAAVKYEARLAA